MIIGNLNRAMLMFGVALMMLSVTGCKSATDSAASDQEQSVRPIDKVRGGIVAVSDQLEATLASAELAAADSSSSRSKRSAYRGEVKSLQSSIQSLRSDAVELRDRADQYLDSWSEQSIVIGAEGGVTSGPNVKRERSKAKYDQMVASLHQARDVVLPLMTDLEKLQSSLDTRDLSTVQPDVRQARQRGNEAIAHLTAATTQMDELKKMLTPTRGGSAR